MLNAAEAGGMYVVAEAWVQQRPRRRSWRPSVDFAMLSARRARGLVPPSAARRAMQDFRCEVLQAGGLGVVRDSPVQGTSAYARA